MNRATNRATSNRRASLAVAALAAVLVFGACGDARVNQLQVGIGRDSMFKLLGKGAPAGDSMPFIYRHNQYFVASSLWDVYFYDPQDRKYPATKSVQPKDVIPIFLRNGKVDGWGWSHGDDLTAKYQIPVRRDFTK